MTMFRRQVAMTVVLAGLTAGASAACRRVPMADLTRLVEARRLVSETLVELTKSIDAGNQAVMADTDEASVSFAREAETAATRVSQNVDTLTPLLGDLGYTDEKRLLDEFRTRYTEFRTLDKDILALAVENTNVKAQRLSFGPAFQAADAFQEALRALAGSAKGAQAAEIKELAATAAGAVREMQALQAPHIAESDEAAMTRLEKRAADAESVARASLAKLQMLSKGAGLADLARATVALDRFAATNGEIVTLSRRNSNVRSLALSLGEKRTKSAACEDSLRALQEALSKRGFTGTK